MYKLHLILKYLLKRRIAWVSLLAVMLCTTMVLVVISVMGGWLEMFKSSFRGLSGDIVIEAKSVKGFPYYDEIIAAIEKDPDCQVEAAVPSIETGALVDFGSGPKLVKAIGLPMNEIDKVANFHKSLYRQYTEAEEKLKEPNLDAKERERLEQLMRQPPSFDLFDEVKTPLAALPAGLEFEPAPANGLPLRPGTIARQGKFPLRYRNALRYDALRHMLLFKGTVDDEARTLLKSLSPDAQFQQAIDRLYEQSKTSPPVEYLDELRTDLEKLPPELKSVSPAATASVRPRMIVLPPDFPDAVLYYDPVHELLIFEGRMDESLRDRLKKLSTDDGYKEAIDRLYNRQFNKYFGMIVGIGVIGIHRDENSKWIRQPPHVVYRTPTALTLLDLSGSQKTELRSQTLDFFIVDDSHLGVWQYDSNCVYVPLDVLQAGLGLKPIELRAESPGQKPAFLPARVTHIHIKVRAGIDPNDETKLQHIRGQIERVVNAVRDEKKRTDPLYDAAIRDSAFEVTTWQDVNRVWISAVEHEKLLTVMLFGIMCIVAIFLIFCIFYMIVAEKTRDIGIIKSVGATSAGVAGIFLGYGLVIGLLGAGLGLLLSYIIVHNINEMHHWLGLKFGLKIWDPQVYVFDNIPNKMSSGDIMWIIPTAIVASVMGALIPAIRAARMNPVEALRWE